jgi:hypothetical protein
MSEYQEAGRLLDAVLTGHRIEIMPDDPVGQILLLFKAYWDSRSPLGPNEKWRVVMEPDTELYVQKVIADLERWLARTALHQDCFTGDK